MKFFINKLKSERRSSKLVREAPKIKSIQRGAVLERKKNKTRTKASFPYLKILTFFLAIAFLGITAHSLFIAEFLLIKDISVEGADRIGSSMVREKIEKILESGQTDLVKKSNYILVNSSSLETALKQEYPRIRKVDIEKIFPDRISIRIEERKPELVSCSQLECWMIDEQGSAFAKADFDLGNLDENKLFIIKQENSQKKGQNEFNLSLDYLDFIGKITSGLSEMNIAIKKEIYVPIFISGDIQVITEEGWKIFFNKNSGAENGLSLLGAVLKNTISEDDRKNLEYIDVRLAEKVYYKLKNSSQDVSGEEAVGDRADSDSPPKRSSDEKSIKKKD